jgi:hypothetical protein
MKLKPSHLKIMVITGILIFSAGVIIIDLTIGHFVRLPVLFVLPVMAASWYCGIVAGQLFAVGLPALRLLLMLPTEMPWPLEASVLNALIFIGTLSLISALTYQVNKQRKQIKILHGFLPICSFCKKIRVANGTWEQLEKYITNNSEAVFSHGVCPECAKKYYGDLSLKK